MIMKERNGKAGKKDGEKLQIKGGNKEKKGTKRKVHFGEEDKENDRKGKRKDRQRCNEKERLDEW